MSQQLQPSIGEMIDLVRRMPRAPLPELEARLDPAKVQCFCGKYVPIASCGVAWSGFTDYVVALCPDHARDAADYARVICPRCRTIVLLLEPFRDKHGFQFRKGGVYHVQACPVCVPGLDHSAIVEKIVFYKQRGILYCEDTKLLL